MCKLSSCDFTVNHVKYCVIFVELKNICFLNFALNVLLNDVQVARFPNRVEQNGLSVFLLQLKIAAFSCNA